MSVQTRLYKHPNEKVKLKIFAMIITGFQKQNMLEHPFSDMFQNDVSLFQLEMKRHF